jgi:hypothetical protein
MEGIKNIGGIRYKNDHINLNKNQFIFHMRNTGELN